MNDVNIKDVIVNQSYGYCEVISYSPDHKINLYSLKNEQIICDIPKNVFTNQQITQEV